MYPENLPQATWANKWFKKTKNTAGKAIGIKQFSIFV